MGRLVPFAYDCGDGDTDVLATDEETTMRTLRTLGARVAALTDRQ